MIALWAHQLAAADAVDRELLVASSTLIVHATGAGKTTTGAEVTVRRSRVGRTLWIAHREELVNQAAARLRGHGLRVGIEMADERAGDLSLLDVVVASVQTLAPARLARHFRPTDFDTIIIDEAHHAPARTYRQIREFFPTAKVVGLTATPDRGDGVAMARAFESVAHVYEIRQAIPDGFLSPIIQRAIQVEGFDLSRVRTTRGDLDEGELERLLLDPALLQSVAAAIVDAAGERKTMVFAVRVAHAHALAATLNGFEPGSARALDGFSGRREGDDPDVRANTLADFAAGKFRRLVNCSLFTEGFDEPSIECVAVVRPTKSRAFYCLSSDTEILTPDGWARIGSAPSVVAGYDASSGRIQWEKTTGHVVRAKRTDEQWVEYSGPLVDFRVTDQHRMFTGRRVGSGGKRRVEWSWGLAGSMPAATDALRVPVSGIQDPAGGMAPATGDELVFLGIVMTDGTINKITRQITITQSAAAPTVAEIDRTLDAIGVKYTRSVADRRGKGARFEPTAPTVKWTISRGAPRGRGRGVLTGWEALAIAPLVGKGHTQDFERLTAQQLRYLLDGLQIGDGVKRRRRGWKICIGKKREDWCDALQSLCLRRGLHANRLTDATALILSVAPVKVRSVKTSTGNGRPVVRLVDDPGMCWCVEVPSGAIVVRRHGRAIIVGNCQMVGRGMRRHPGKRNMLILDFQGNAGRHTLVCPFDILGGADVDPLVKKKAEALIAERPDLELLAALEQATREIAEERRAKLLDLARYRSVEVDPFELADVTLGGLVGRDVKPANDGASIVENLGYLNRHAAGLDVERMNPTTVGIVATALRARLAAGGATWAQSRVLMRAGLPGDVPAPVAARVVDALARNGWIATDEIRRMLSPAALAAGNP